MQHLKWGSLELLLDVRSLHLFCTSFKLEMGLIDGQSAQKVSKNVVPYMYEGCLIEVLYKYDEVWGKCIEVLIKCALPADVGCQGVNKSITIRSVVRSR